MALRRHPRDPFAEVLLPAGPASRRARRLTLGRMRPPADLVAQAVRERRRQVARFLQALEATATGGATMREPAGPVQVGIHESSVGFWLVDTEGRVIPDPAGRTGFSIEDVRRLVAAGDLLLDSTEGGVALQARLGRGASEPA